MNRKRRRRGFLGGLLSLGSMFIPGGKWWLKPLIGAITKGGVTLSTEDMLKKEKDRIDKMKKGTLADELISSYSDIAQDEISSLDPVKAAVESFAADAILQAGAKSISKGKEAKELPSLETLYKAEYPSRPEGYNWPRSYEQYKDQVGSLQEDMDDVFDKMDELEEAIKELQKDTLGRLIVPNNENSFFVYDEEVGYKILFN